MSSINHKTIDENLQKNSNEFEKEQNPKDIKKNKPKHDKNVQNIQEFKMGEILKEEVRFKIMFLLYNYPQMNFTEIRVLLNLTAGNLMHHLKKLVDIHWIKEKLVFIPRVLKFYKITILGEENFNHKIKKLKNLLDLIDI